LNKSEREAFDKSVEAVRGLVEVASRMLKEGAQNQGSVRK
jgi:hypothetical protein